MKHMMIIGASSSIAREVAARLVNLDYQFTFVDFDPFSLSELKQQFGNRSHTICCDLSDPSQLADLCAHIADNAIPLDQIFFNAGILKIGPVNTLSVKDIDLQLDINLRSVIHVLNACIEPLKQSLHAHIVVTVSMGGILALKDSATYSASKFGLRGFLCALQQELKPYRIGVSGIYPSGVDTPMLRYEAQQGGNALNFLSLPLQPEDVAYAVIKSLNTKQLEVYVPYKDSIPARLVSFFPWILDKCLTYFERAGEKGRRKFLDQIEQSQ